MKTTNRKATAVAVIAMISALCWVSTSYSARNQSPLEDGLTAAADPNPLPVTPPITPLAPAPAVPPAAEPQNQKPARKLSEPAPPGAKESARPAPKLSPGEARTVEEATARAADRNDPSGALIFDPPLSTGGPAKAP